MKWRINLLSIFGAIIGILSVVIYGLGSGGIFLFYLIATFIALFTPVAVFLQIPSLLLVLGGAFSIFGNAPVAQIGLFLLSIALVGFSNFSPLGPGYHPRFSLNPSKWSKLTVLRYPIEKKELIETESFKNQTKSSKKDDLLGKKKG